MYIVIYFQNKNKLYQIWRKKRTTQNWNTYIEYKRKYNLIEAKIKYNYYEKKVHWLQSRHEKSLECNK